MLKVKRELIQKILWNTRIACLSSRNDEDGQNKKGSQINKDDQNKKESQINKDSEATKANQQMQKGPSSKNKKGKTAMKVEKEDEKTRPNNMNI